MRNPLHKNICLFFLFFISQLSFGQLTNFSLIVTKTDESCTGNGALFFNVTGQTTGSSIVYSIYNLPNTTTPIAVLSTNTFTGLSAGNYRVIATQTLGNLSNTQQQDIQIFDVRNALTFQVSSQPTTCNTGNIVVNVLSGSPATYEIVSGPVTIAPQTSNVFNNLGPGTYNVRVNDICGDGYVQTYTLNLVNLPNLTLQASHVCGALASCNTIPTTLLITANLNTIIRYPLTLQTTIFPPTGVTIVQNQTLVSGDATSQITSIVIPFYNNQSYSYNVRVTDACGNVYSSNGNIINEQFQASSQQTFNNCLKGIEVALCNFFPPYSINFLSAPAGFNPVTYNGGHPGPFSSSFTNYVSTLTNEIPNGNYLIEVTDACGRIAQTQVVIQDVLPGYEFLPNPDLCSDLVIVKIPNGGPRVTSVIVTAAPATFNHPLPYDVSFNIQNGIFLMEFAPGMYTLEGIDVCGKPFSYTFVIPPRNINVVATPLNAAGCTSASGMINVNVIGIMMASIAIIQAPPTFSQTLPFNASNSILYPQNTMAQIQNLPIGDYTIDVVDTCGNHYIRSLTISALISQNPLSFYQIRGCGENFTSIALASPNLTLQIVTIIAAPSSLPNVLPYNVSFNIASNGIFYMNSLPEGTYTFYTKDACGIERTETFQVIGYHQSTNNIQIVGNCGSFNLNMNYTDNNDSSHNYWLQKFDPITNQWVHPITGVPFVTNSIPDQTNSYLLVNLATNYNIASLGTFRILTEYYYYANGSQGLVPCVETIKTFDFNGDLEIVSAFAIPCATQGTQVFVVANGVPPLDYKITSKNGLPFVVNNGTSNVFSGLQAGIYNFRVEDFCGNIVNRVFDIASLPEPSISSSNLCEGQVGQLSVDIFPSFNYQWWKDNNTTTILSTTNVLTFNPFFAAAAAGTYYVRIYSSNQTSCVDKIISFVVPLISNPNAGQDGDLVICGNTNTVNLFTALTGTYDTGGIWEETTTSGMLSGNNWLPLGVPFGNYIFKYKVTGLCNSLDEATVTVHFNPAPVIPVVTGSTNYCSSENIQLSVQTIPNATYQWTGPNNFTSTSQNPTITNSTIDASGIYTVKANVNGCESSATISIVVNPNPNFDIETSCINGAYTVSVVPIQNSFSTSTASYSWTGPNGYSNSINPIVITNNPKGIYSVTVTNSDGCSSILSIDVLSTLCTIASGISPNGDGSNESFDLSGFDEIQNLKIFNRYGMTVYEQDNYTNQWHGQQKNSEDLLPGGTYYYLVSFKNGTSKTGWVYLSR